MHIPFIHIVKFKLLAKLQVDHLAHPFVSCLIISLHLLTVFAYHVFDYYYCYYYYYISPSEIFHLWSFIGFWVTASPLRSRGLLLSILAGLSKVVVWMVSIILQIFNSSNLFSKAWGTFQMHPLQMVSLLLSRSTVF